MIRLKRDFGQSCKRKRISRSGFNHKRKGFTISELALALGFIGILLMTVAALTIFILGIYQKGLTIKAVNTSGEALVDEFTRSIQAAVNLNNLKVKDNQIDVDTSEAIEYNDSHFWKQWNSSGNITIINSGGETSTTSRVPLHGHFCTGSDSYIWNTGYVLPENAGRFKMGTTNLNNSNYQARVNGRVVHLLKVDNDAERKVCGVTNGNYTSAVTGKTTTELLPANSENPTVLYSLTLFSAATHGLTGHSYVSGTFILGTEKGAIDIFTNSDICKEDPTEGLSTDFNYCAINKFNFGVRATGKTAGS